MLASDLEAHGFGGRMWYYNSEAGMRMPAVAEIIADDVVLLQQLQRAQKHRFLLMLILGEQHTTDQLSQR
jgi:hypothetical protein